MINLKIHTQPDDETCGPTSLHAIYQYYGLDLTLDSVVKGVERSVSGGTLESMLGKHALLQGFQATLYVNNLNIFDPTWFDKGFISKETLTIKLTAQMKYKRSTVAVTQACQGYLTFSELGGNICFYTLDAALLKQYFIRKVPILTGLSATYLYRSARERYLKNKSIYDDIRGTPCGHFVVLCGYDELRHAVTVADPHRQNPISQDNYYKVSINRLINAIMLGVLTYDASLLIIEPKGV